MSETTKQAPEQAEEPRPICQSCGKKMAKKGDFCPHCGQKSGGGIEPFAKLLARFWKNATHLDNKFLKMSWQLFVPAQVTLAWASGRSKRYPHPVQFFFVVMFFFLLFLKHFAGEMQTVGTQKNDDLMISLAKKPSGDAQKMDLFQALQRHVEEKNMWRVFDSLPPDLRTPVARQAVDSVFGKIFPKNTEFLRRLKETSNGLNPLDSLPISAITYQIIVATEDVVNLTPDEIIERYNIRHFWDKILVRQGIKTLKDPLGLVNHYVGSLAWAVLFHITVMAFVMWLLYWREGRYYVEHFVFLLHRHSGTFLAASILLAAQWLLGMPVYFWTFWFLWFLFSLPFALKRYYKQSWGWTLIKYTAIEVAGLAIFTLSFTLSLLAVFSIF